MSDELEPQLVESYRPDWLRPKFHFLLDEEGQFV